MLPATLQLAGEQNALGNTMGAMLIGVVLSAALWGMTLLQTVYYFNRYPNDPWYLRGFVWVTLFLDTAHMGFVTHVIYHYLIATYYDKTALTKIIWSVIIEALPTGVTATLVQLFFAYRVWRLSNKNWLLVLSIVVLVVANVVASVVWTVLAMLRSTYTELLELTPLTMTINALSVGIDVIICVSLCVLLQRSKTGFKSTDTMITKLTIFFVNTGLVTTICALAALFSLVGSPNTLLYAPFYFCIGRCYVTSLLGSLNGRRIMRGNIASVDHQMISFPTSSGSRQATGTNRNAFGQNISIRVDTKHETEFDIGAQTVAELDSSLAKQTGGASCV
ncbi:hypothetical protein CYLTODRAFT_486909 [Cylindrobasidium torrendii FP15055 ss-10]|uniref:DUF6534 domain-containing protein n=1 Tax=Cylindrobasidium torrendii FP15055 ss-10 TaxID=1314674 RepID=A0A0D7BNP1_9AGAR|nr:hypothetical protein CYLTODRAFT_486909 [Cylindrobasidium torrendii FP15055 ss-10]